MSSKDVANPRFHGAEVLKEGKLLMSRPDVPRYFRIATRFWSDEKSSTWSDEVKLAALYFMTCRHRMLEGIFVLSVHYVAADLGWSVKRVRRVIANLETAGFLRFDSGSKVVLIRNALRYQQPENPNMIEGCVRRILELPRTDLLQEFLELVQTHCYRKGVPAVAQSFCEQLKERLAQRLGQLSSTLNLESQSLQLNQKLKHSAQSRHEEEVDRFGRSESQKNRERMEIEAAVTRGG